MSLNRQTAKTFFKTLDKYESIKKMVVRAVDPVNPSLVKNHAKNRVKLDDSFLEVVHDWNDFKRDINQTGDVLNEDNEDGTPKYEHNDKWLEELEETYYDLIEKSEAILDSGNVSQTAENKEVEEKLTMEAAVKQKKEMKLVKELGDQMQSLSSAISNSVKKISDEVIAMVDGQEGVSRVQAYKTDLAAVESKIDDKFLSIYNQYVCLLDDSETEEKKTIKDDFVTMEKAKIDNLMLLLNKKVREAPNLGATSATVDKKGGQTYLKKIDPPMFKGDIVEYADFVRKWKAQIGKAGLSAEGELDRLRDHVPVQAAKALYGETTMAGAWRILEKLYGDKDLITNKLKIQLKSIKPKGKKDQDIVIDLVTEVNNIVLRLKTLQMEQLLKVDSEFLSAIFRVLPDSVQEKWLEFDKETYSYKWDAFMKFLDQARDRALQSKVLLSSYEDEEGEKLTCKKCGLSGHKMRNCPTVKANSANASKVSEDEDDRDIEKKKKKLKKEQREECGKCPLCSKYHTYLRRSDKDEWPTDRMFRCESFVKLSIKDRAAALEKYQCCSKCTSWHHKKNSCPSLAKCGKLVSGKQCFGEHSSMVCGSGSAYCGSIRVLAHGSSVRSSSSSTESSSTLSSCNLSSESSEINTSNDSSFSVESDSDNENFPEVDAVTLLLLQDLKVLGSVSARSCWDNGSNRVLVTHAYAKQNKLRSQNIAFRLDVVGIQGDPQDGVLYELALVENDGSERKIWGFGVENIMETPEPVDLSPIRHLFPHLPSSVFLPLPKKPVDLLIGNNFFKLHPDGGQGRDAAGDLKVLQSRYGDGWVIAGSHPLLKPTAASLTAAALSIVKINKCEIVPEHLPGFWEGDTLGVLPPKRCKRCIGCSNCSDPALIHSRRDQEELEELQKNTWLSDDGLHVNYVFKKDPMCLPNNRAVAVKIAAKQEDRLLKSGHVECYNGEIQKYLDRGAAVRLTKEEMEEWKGPLNYISHHGVEKPSPTTPLRIVTNSSLNNGGNSLNGCLIGGPNSLNPMLDIALRFRCHECGMVFDLTKAYNSLHTGPVERHLRRFIWRFSPDEVWQDFAFDSVAFGDLPAANFLEIGRDMTADAGCDIDKEASVKIKRDSYVDDNISGGSFEAVKRMKGRKLGDGTFSGNITKILNIGKLKPKTIVSTGETDEEAKALLGETVLGYGWDATSDMMKVNLPVYLSNKKKKARMSPPLTLETFHLFPDSKITKRICLGITNGFGDFMGLASPFTIRFKLLMKQLFDGGKQQLLWDDDVPSEAREAWIQLIAEAVETNSLCFPRCVRPQDAIGSPVVVGFGDGAFPAYSACIYIRWETTCNHSVGETCTGDFETNLLWAKARVTPLSGFTVPRSELSGTVLLSRMGATTVKALNADSSMQPNSMVMLIDSKCTISVAEKSTASLKPFFHNRVSELIENVAAIKKVCPVEDLQYVASKENPADLATRGGIKLSEIGPKSFWQCGPTFLCWRRDLWPVTRDFVPKEVPEEEIRTRISYFFHLRAKVLLSKTSSTPDLWAAIMNTLYYSNSFDKVKRILARLIKGWGMKAKDETLTHDTIGEPTAKELEVAERLMLLTAMPLTAQAFYDKKLDSLYPKKDGQVIVTTGRLGEKSLSRLLGISSLPIIMPTTRAAYLYMVRAHEGEHNTVHKSIVETLARSRQSVWIVKGRILAKKVCQSCFVCKLINKQLSGQLMAKINNQGGKLNCVILHYYNCIIILLLLLFHFRYSFISLYQLYLDPCD
jgi:hypothetical protein